MYTIVIIDDEYLIARGIEKSCSWEKFGARVDLVTTDAEEALNYIISNKPDIVFTDINMGEISGIDIMKKSRANNVNSEFVIISGYNEFEYVQSAMKYNAFYYLLKPIDKKELENIMAKLILKIKDKKEIDTSFEFIEKLVVNTKISSHRELFELNKVNLIESGFQTLILEGNISRIKLNEILKSKKYIEIEIGREKRAFFINTNEDLYKDEVIKILEKEKIKVGISSFYQKDLSPYKSFVEADIALSNSFIYKNINTFKYIESKNKISMMLEKCMQCITDYQKLELFLKNMPEYFEINNLTILELTLLCNYLSNSLEYLSITSEEIMPSEHKTYQEIYSSFKSIEDLSNFLYDYTKIFLENKSFKIENQDKTRFEEILSYIQENYCNNLYLADIANEFFYNQTYVSDLIKKNLGKNFIEYVIELRIKKACMLLSTTSDSISSIAGACGYNDYCYFTKQFKKIIGKTPSAYRKEFKSEEI